MTATVLTAESLQRIEREAAKYPPEQRQSAVLAALAIAQEQEGWLSSEVQEEVARVLRMPPVWVYEVASFYTMCNLARPGKRKVVMCTNLPCALSGAADAAEHLKRRCGVTQFGETSADGRFTVKEGECFGACGDAPVMMVNDKTLLGHMTAEKIDRWVEEGE